MNARLTHREGFAINFIRRENRPAGVRLASAYAVIGYLTASTLLAIWLIVASTGFLVQSNRLQANLHGRLPNPAALDLFKQEMKDLDHQMVSKLAQFNTISNLKKQRFLVGGKLAALEKTLPAKTWVMQISGQRSGRSIDLQAAYLLDSGTSYTVPANKWVQALRSEPLFNQGLKAVESSSSSRKRQGDSELLLFNLSADWER